MDCWVRSLDALFPASLSICAFKSGHRFLYNLGTRSTALSVAPRSRFCPIHRFRLSPHTLSYRADHTRRVDPFVSSVWDRSSVQTNLQFTICRFLSSLRSFPSNLPCDQHTMLPTGCSFETKMSRASLLDARLPAVHLQRLGWPLVSATIFNPWLQLCASTCRLPPNGHTRTPHGHTGLPQSGCSHRALAINSSHVQTQTTEYWRARTTTKQSK